MKKEIVFFQCLAYIVSIFEMDVEAEHDAGSSKDALCAVTNVDSSKVKKDIQRQRCNQTVSGEAN